VNLSFGIYQYKKAYYCTVIIGLKRVDFISLGGRIWENFAGINLYKGENHGRRK
jgi:hypothetical protein